MIEAFVTVLVVANVLPILPVVLKFTEDLDVPARNTLLLQAVLLGNGVAAAMVLGGGLLLEASRVTAADLRIAGGVILLVFATFDLLFNREMRKRPLGEVVAVEERAAPALIPMAVPVLVGPAVLATVVVVAEHHGRIVTLGAVAGNTVVNAAILLLATPIHHRLGPGPGRALGKVMGLILAAVAVSMIRNGVLEVIANHPPG